MSGEPRSIDPPQWLFSYGTLRQLEIQLAVFGHALDSIDDGLSGYEVGTLTITDADVIRQSGSDRHPVLRRSDPDAIVAGAALRVDAADLLAADRYEAAAYIRIPVVLTSGRHAFAYVGREEPTAPAT